MSAECLGVNNSSSVVYIGGVEFDNQWPVKTRLQWKAFYTTECYYLIVGRLAWSRLLVIWRAVWEMVLILTATILYATGSAMAPGADVWKAILTERRDISIFMVSTHYPCGIQIADDKETAHRRSCTLYYWPRKSISSSGSIAQHYIQSKYKIAEDAPSGHFAPPLLPIPYFDLDNMLLVQITIWRLCRSAHESFKKMMLRLIFVFHDVLSVGLARWVQQKVARLLAVPALYCCNLLRLW